MQVLIVDDEALARNRLRSLLQDCLPDNARIDEATDAMDAIAKLHRDNYDLLFLDIQMPHVSGLSLAREVRDLDHVPALIFVTAHPEHALQAFELDAVDYLSKPIQPQRLEQAIQKALFFIEAKNSSKANNIRHITILDRGRMLRLPLSEVLYFKAEMKYITVRTAQSTYILNGSLVDIEQDYADSFVRIHRNALVSKQHISAIDKDSSVEDAWVVRMTGIPDVLAISRRQVASLRQLLQDN